MEPYHVRTAAPRDIQIILSHRRKMFEDMGYNDSMSLDLMLATSTPLIQRGLEKGTYRGWLVETPTGEVIAGGGIIILDFHSHPQDPKPRRAWVVNMYTEYAYRRRGLARLLMNTMIEWSRAEGMRFLYLHASDNGRSLYETLGFKPTNEMKINLQ
ncbi:MAG: GNAT family N-acetyltransferase [Ignavibacteriales bacterium]|nr:GNAT family N-acetyltransferase [Ignavibacteriales bacterium]MBI3788053.1 GNAT family N-acetyltransferase [Ignavibacteriales bacterium]